MNDDIMYISTDTIRDDQGTLVEDDIKCILDLVHP